MKSHLKPIIAIFSFVPIILIGLLLLKFGNKLTIK